MKKVFNIKYWWADLIGVIIGLILFIFFNLQCKSGEMCPPFISYIGLVIIGLAILHFVVSLIIKIISKLKKN